MKAIRFEQAGDPQQVLKLMEIDKPEPKENEVRLRVLGSAINPADEMFIRGRYRFKPVFPQTAGLEGAGIIDSLGENVNLPKGAIAAFLYRNAWAEYIIVPKDDLFLLPDNFPVEKAVQFSLNPITAWGLLERAKLQTGDWLLLTAGNSTVSRIITQIAKTRNINVISVVRDVDFSNSLRMIGAAEVINSSAESIVNRVDEITSGKGASCAIDSVGGETGTEVLKCLSVNGKMIIYGLLSQENVQFHNSLFIYKNISVSGFGIRGFIESLPAIQKNEMTQSLIDLISKDSFNLSITTGYPLEKYNEAFSEYYQHSKNGKIIFKI